MGGQGELPLDGVDYHQLDVHRLVGDIAHVQYILIMGDSNT